MYFPIKHSSFACTCSPVILDVSRNYGPFVHSIYHIIHFMVTSVSKFSTIWEHLRTDTSICKLSQYWNDVIKIESLMSEDVGSMPSVHIFTYAQHSKLLKGEWWWYPAGHFKWSDFCAASFRGISTLVSFFYLRGLTLRFASQFQTILLSVLYSLSCIYFCNLLFVPKCNTVMSSPTKSSYEKCVSLSENEKKDRQLASSHALPPADPDVESDIIDLSQAFATDGAVTMARSPATWDSMSSYPLCRVLEKGKLT